jgi:hypothetical protein
MPVTLRVLVDDERGTGSNRVIGVMRSRRTVYDTGVIAVTDAAVECRVVRESHAYEAPCIATPMARQGQRSVDTPRGHLERVGLLPHHVGAVEHPVDLARRVRHVVEGHAPVLVDGDAQHPPIAGGGDLDGLDVEADLLLALQGTQQGQVDVHLSSPSG